MDEKTLKVFMENLLMRYGAKYAFEQVEVEVVVADEEAQVDFVISPKYIGFFACTKLMEQITTAIGNDVKSGRLDAMKKITVVIRQDKTFDMSAIKEAQAERKRKRRETNSRG